MNYPILSQATSGKTARPWQIKYQHLVGLSLNASAIEDFWKKISNILTKTNGKIGNHYL